MPLAFLDRPPYPGLRSANNMTFPCQEGVVLYCITERFALRKHLPISLGHPPALPRAGQASSSPPRPAGVPADTLAKPLSLAAAGASFAAKVREHFPQRVPCWGKAPGGSGCPAACLPQAALCGAHQPSSTDRQRAEQAKGQKKTRGSGCAGGPSRSHHSGEQAQRRLYRAWGLASVRGAGHSLTACGKKNGKKLRGKNRAADSLSPLLQHRGRPAGKAGEGGKRGSPPNRGSPGEGPRGRGRPNPAVPSPSEPSRAKKNRAWPRRAARPRGSPSRPAPQCSARRG